MNALRELLARTIQDRVKLADFQNECYTVAGDGLAWRAAEELDRLERGQLPPDLPPVVLRQLLVDVLQALQPITSNHEPGSLVERLQRAIKSLEAPR